MRFHHILVPVDFSSSARDALAYALTLAQDSGATVDVLHVVEGEPPDDAIAMTSFLASMTIPPGILLTPRTEAGEPSQRIAHVARTGKHDLIVMGAHGISQRSHVRLGDVAERVVRDAPCAVFAICAGNGDSTEVVTPWLPRDHDHMYRIDVANAASTFRSPETGNPKHAEECLGCSKLIAACLSLETGEIEFLCRKRQT